MSNLKPNPTLSASTDPAPKNAVCSYTFKYLQMHICVCVYKDSALSKTRAGDLTLIVLDLSKTSYQKPNCSCITSPPLHLTAMVEGAGFEPAKAEPADLQSAPVDRLGTPPRCKAAHFQASQLSCQQFKQLFALPREVFSIFSRTHGNIFREISRNSRMRSTSIATPTQKH